MAAHSLPAAASVYVTIVTDYLTEEMSSCWNLCGMKTLSLVTIAVVSLLSVFTCSLSAQTVFPKDSKVRLTKDTPLLFKTEQTRIGKAGETFTVIQHNTATKRVFVLATDAAGKQVALNVADDAVEPVPVATAKPQTAPEPSVSASEYDRKSKQLVPDGAEAVYATNSEKGKLYRHAGNILQVTEEMMLVDNAAEKRPWAVLTFGDPKKVESSPIQQGALVRAIIRFEGFKNVPMVSGATKRLAQFTCVGFEVLDGNNHYVDCSVDGAPTPPVKAP